MGSGIQTTVRSNEFTSTMTVCRNGFHNGVMTYMLQISKSTIHRNFVTWVVFMEAIFSCLKLKPDDRFLTYSISVLLSELFCHNGTYIY